MPAHCTPHFLCSLKSWKFESWAVHSICVLDFGLSLILSVCVDISDTIQCCGWIEWPVCFGYPMSCIFLFIFWSFLPEITFCLLRERWVCLSNMVGLIKEDEAAMAHEVRSGHQQLPSVLRVNHGGTLIMAPEHSFCDKHWLWRIGWSPFKTNTSLLSPCRSPSFSFTGLVLTVFDLLLFFYFKFSMCTNPLSVTYQVWYIAVYIDMLLHSLAATIWELQLIHFLIVDLL